MKNLKDSLEKVNWHENINSFLLNEQSAKTIDQCAHRIAIWSKQFEETDRNNPALCFIREMQLGAQNLVALTALGLYKPAASTIRTILETALYYTYFRSHPVELSSLLREKKYYITKENILEYHKLHTENFRSVQEKIGLITLIEEVYKKLSAITHGQIPGVWSGAVALKDTKYTQDLCADVSKTFEDTEESVHMLFLCTSGKDLWDSMSSSAKKALLKGIPGETKNLLRLDAN